MKFAVYTLWVNAKNLVTHLLSAPISVQLRVIFHFRFNR